MSYESEAGPLTALLTGDAEAEQIEKMVQSGGTGSSGAVAVNVLKAGHHGSKAGMTPKLAQGLSAKHRPCELRREQSLRASGPSDDRRS